MNVNVWVKILVCCATVLISGKTTLLFAAENSANVFGNSSAGANASQEEQMRQLQLQQVQQMAQSSSTNNAPTAAGGAPAVNPSVVTGSAAAQGELVGAQPGQQTGFPGASPPPPLLGQTATGQQANANPDQAVAEAAFSSMARSALPMTPDQIQRLRQLFNTTQYAVATAPGVPPRPVIRSQFVNLAPGTTPPPIRLKQGVVTSLAFLDSTGQPWPIEAYDVGDPATFSVQWNKSDNLLFIQPSKPYYEERNLVVRLKELHTPVTLTLLSPQLSDNNAVDYRVDLHLSGLGPNAAPVTANNLPDSANPELLGVLSGLPPAGARELTLSGGGDSQVWLAHDKMYLRTRLAVLSPGWLASMASADGMRAYEMQKTPMLLMSQNGRTVQLKVEGF